MTESIISLFFHYANWKFPQMGSHEHVRCIWKISAFHDDSKLIFIQVLYKILVPTSQVFPTFQVQVLICTGDSGSKPERALYR